MTIVWYSRLLVEVLVGVNADSPVLDVHNNLAIEDVNVQPGHIPDIDEMSDHAERDEV